MDEKELIRLRKQLLYGVLHDGKAKSLEDALDRAERAVKWILEGKR